MFRTKSAHLLEPEATLPGRETPVQISAVHAVNGHNMKPPFPDHLASIQLGLGCFWGAERLLWQQTGVHVTAVGYAGGTTPNPGYEEVCSGLTNHAEVVLVVFDPSVLSLQKLLSIFWEAHDPTQGMQQGNDRGTQYRSAVYAEDDTQLQVAEASKNSYQLALKAAGLGEITTDISTGQTFWYAEEYHQQYLAKNPGGYCALRGTGVQCAG